MMKVLVAVLVLTGVLASNTHAAFYSSRQDFSSFSPNDLLDGSGWSSTNVVVTNAAAIGFANDFAAYFGEQAVATNMLNQTELGPARVWSDFRIKPAIGMRHDVVPDDVQVYFYFDEDGYIEYLAANDNWARATNNIFGNPVDAVMTGQWQRVSIFQDYAENTYAIILNDVVIAQDIPFVSTANGYHSFNMMNLENEAYLDEIRIHDSLVSDLEGDGNANATPDAQELDTYGYVARTLVVDDNFSDPPPPYFNEISNALAVWRERDTIQVHAGNYGPITVSNSITLMGDDFSIAAITVTNGATLIISNSVAVNGAITVFDNAAIVAGGNITAGSADVAGVINVGDNTFTITSALDLSGSGNVQIAAGGTLQADSIVMGNNTQIISTGGAVAHPLLNLTGIFTINGSAWNASVSIAQTLPFSDDFENYNLGQAMSGLGIFGWEADSTSVVASDTAISGERSAMLPDGTELKLHISRGDAPRVWTDFYLRPVFGEGPDLSEADDKGFASFVDSDGNLNVPNQAGTEWEPLTMKASWDHDAVTFTNRFVGAFDTNRFTRVSVYQNYSEQTYSVFIDGSNLVAHARAFPDNNASYIEFIMENSGTDAFLDAMLVTDAMPPFAEATVDINNNGMDDREEIHWFGNLTTFAGIRGSIFRFR